MADWQTFSDRINNVAPSATLAVDSKAKAMKAAGVDVIGFGAGEPDFPTPADVVDAAVKACNDPRNYKYTPTAGLPELREAIAAKVLRDSGYEVTADQVVVTNGGKQAVYESFQVLLNDGDEVIIPTPFWTSYPEAVKLAGGKPVEVFAGADRGFEPDIAAIEAARTERTKAIIITSPNNPTGAVWSRETIRAIGEWAVEHHVWVISDEIYSELLFEGEFCSPANFEQIRDQVLVINGFSKAFAMTGWRLGYLLSNADLSQQLTKVHQFVIMSAPTSAQYAAIEALEHGIADTESMRREYESRRNLICARLNRMGLTTNVPKGTFYVFTNITSSGLTSDEFCVRLLEEHKVAIVPGTAFGDSGEGFVRISYATSMENIKEACSRIEAFLESLHLPSESVDSHHGSHS